MKREICKTFNQFSFLLNLINQSKMTAPTKEAAMDTTAHSGTSDDPLADGNAGGLGGERGVDDDGNTGTAATPQNNVAGKNSNEQHSFAACFSLASSAADSSPSGSPAESTIFSATTGGAVGGGDDGASTVMTGGGGEGGGGVSLFGNDDDDGDDEEMEYNDDDNRGQEFSRNPNGAEGGGSSNSIAAMQVARRITLAGDGIMMESSDNNGNNTTTFTANTINNAGAARDDYVRSAARFRSLVGSALRRVADGFGTTAKSSNSKKNVHVGGAGSPSLQIATTATSVSGYKRSRALGGGGGGNSAEDDDDSSGGSFLSPGGGGGGDTSSRGVRRRKLLGGGSGTCGGLGGRDYAADLAREKAAEVLVLQRVSG